MGEAARRLTSRQPYEVQPALRVVPTGSRNARARRTQTRRSARGFRVCAACMVLVFALALVRVSLAVGAEQDAIDASRLQTRITSEQQATKSLEASKSSLGAPSRIASIASSALNMKAPAKVSYMTIQTSAKSASDTSVKVADMSGATAGLAGIAKVVSSAMDVAAGEAQVLLVGDVGLASAK